MLLFTYVLLPVDRFWHGFVNIFSTLENEKRYSRERKQWESERKGDGDVVPPPCRHHHHPGEVARVVASLMFPRRPH